MHKIIQQSELWRSRSCQTAIQAPSGLRIPTLVQICQKQAHVGACPHLPVASTPSAHSRSSEQTCSFRLALSVASSGASCAPRREPSRQYLRKRACAFLYGRIQAAAAGAPR
jgi:hypothetical protein